MSSFVVYNPFDQSFLEVADGGTVHIQMPTAYAEQDTWLRISRTDATDKYSFWQHATLEGMAFSPDVVVAESALFAPYLVATFSAVRAVGAVSVIGVNNVLSSSDGVGANASCRVIVHWVGAAEMVAPPVPWMPPGPLDLQWDMFTGNLASAACATFLAGLKQGSDVEFAVLPYQAGDLITADVTAITFCIRAQVDQQEYGPIILNTDDPTQNTIDTDEAYYSVKCNLSSNALTSFFSDLNDAAALATGDAVAVAVAAAQKLACVLEVRATHSTGTYTSVSFPITILQALTP